jgi:hypothetical protein
MKNKSQLTDGHVQCNGGAFHYYLSECIVSLKNICFYLLYLFDNFYFLFIFNTCVYR